MRRIVACALVVLLVAGVAVPAAHAGGRTATNVALGLASFAVFNQLFWPLAYGRPVYVASPVYAAPIYVERPIYYQQVYVPPAASTQAPPYATVVQYPHGRYELRGDGIQTPYQWVWIPNPPPPPPPPAAAPAPPPAPSR